MDDAHLDAIESEKKRRARPLTRPQQLCQRHFRSLRQHERLLVIGLLVLSGFILGFYAQVAVFFLHVRVGFTGSVLPTTEMSLSSKLTQSLIEDTRRVMYVCKKTNWDYVGLMLHYNKCGAQVVSCKWFNNREVYSPNVVIRTVKRPVQSYLTPDAVLTSEAEAAGGTQAPEIDPLRIIDTSKP
ncbi:hypothetical protein P43SY_003619 [Pythium insidiosum]|uniref:Uncharacterized protein n=1 Tax=Pythium insidiosum TaxID=114742 RepID=A0AAD5M8E5_PYTIN|nr:hypothetical protein P43SY_003619 [Pythium insidiosum]